MKPDATRSPLRQGEVDSLVGRVADDFLDRLNRGERPQVQQYLQQYPQVASVLGEVLPALELIGSLETSGDASVASLTRGGGDPDAGRIGDFRILRELGRGGMGVVYEAEQISLCRRVALKVLPFAAAMDERHLQRFRNEAQAAAHLQHQHIVPVYAVGCERGVHYYAMQFVEGRTLGEVIGELRALNDSTSQPQPRGSDDTCTRTPVFFRSVAHLGMQAAEGLEHAHQFGVVHRDIKPANLLVDARQNLWITDFGLAHLHDDTRLTMTGDLLGTLRYMSPEQALAKRTIIDHRADIYSLGATLYELLTLRAVFDGADRQELLRQIAWDEPVSLRLLNPAISIDLETIVLKCLAKNPDERFATARELADDLQRFLRDEPIRSRRPTTLERSRKWARRHQSFVVAAAVILMLAVIGLVVTTALVWREKSNTDRALAQAQLNAQAAEANLAKARQAVDQLLTRVAQQRLLDVPGMEPLRRQLLEDALTFYNGFLETSGDDPRVYDETVLACLRVGGIYYVLGRIGQAESVLRRAADLVEQSHASGRDPHPQHVSVFALLGATLYRNDRLEEAQGVLARGLSMAQSLAGRFPQNVAYRDQQFQLLLNLALTHHYHNRAEAAALLEQALALELAGAKDPRRLATIYHQQGTLHQRAGQFADADIAQSRAIELLENVVLEAPQPPANRISLAGALARRGDARAALERWSEAEQDLRRCAQLHDRVFAGSPAVEWFGHLSAHSKTQLASLLVGRGSYAEAEPMLRGAIAIYEQIIRGRFAATDRAQVELSAWLAADLPDPADDPPGTQDLLYYHRAANGARLQLAALLTASDRGDEADALYLQVLEAQRQLEEDPNPDRLFRRAVAVAHASTALKFVQVNRPVEAERCARWAAARYASLVGDSPDRVEMQERMAGEYFRLGQILQAQGRFAESIEMFRAAAHGYAQLPQEEPRARAIRVAQAGSLEGAARLLANCTDESVRDPLAAVELAQRAVALIPESGNYWNTLGVARFRAGDDAGAIEAFNRSMQLRKNGGDSFEWFPLAIIHHRRGESERARDFYHRALLWMQQNAPDEPELVRFRAEAELLLTHGTPSGGQSGADLASPTRIFVTSAR